MGIRAFFQAANVDGVPAPYDTLHLKVFYPAQTSGSEPAQALTALSADSQHAPFPVVLFFNGFNCEPELYQWLAVKLAERQLVVVTFAWITEALPGLVALTPGVHLEQMAPDTYGTAPTAAALPTLLAALERLQARGVLAGLLNLQQIIIGGHSAGGRVAIESATPRFFPQVAAAFAYAAHTGAAVHMGYKPGTIARLPDTLPLLLLGGTCDGVIAHSSQLYGVAWEQATTPVTRTFREAITGGRGDSYLVLLEGANHFSITHPADDTTGSRHLDFAATQPAVPIRLLLAEVLGLFIDAHVRRQHDALERLLQLLQSTNPLLAAVERK